ncbi:small ribosomal subunit protein uS14m-like isoform X2 [Lycorma delicatula]|uniref:small ribosomal subunit protein uS14m-like isoform X2 n=1 Tax=Lycorma delicatula TaxID=130591 RepID=UPI003F514922
MLSLGSRLVNVFKQSAKRVLGNEEVLAVATKQQSCSEWTDARMRKDVRKRINCSNYAPLKTRLLSLKRNKILPPELREAAEEDLLKLPTDVLGKKIVWRCAVTSRPRGVVYRWRVSRIIFRHLSDYNKLAGVIRAKW